MRASRIFLLLRPLNTDPHRPSLTATMHLRRHTGTLTRTHALNAHTRALATCKINPSPPFTLFAAGRPQDAGREENKAAWAVLTEWRKPVLCAFASDDIVMKGEFFTSVPARGARMGCDASNNNVAVDHG